MLHLTSLLHEGEEFVEEVLPLGVVREFVELKEKTRRREIIKIMSGALSTKG